jgi:hypothetical protein
MQDNRQPQFRFRLRTLLLVVAVLALLLVVAIQQVQIVRQQRQIRLMQQEIANFVTNQEKLTVIARELRDHLEHAGSSFDKEHRQPGQ